MKDEFLLQQLDEWLRWQQEQPPGAIFQDLIRRGIIDEEGRVLIRMPQPPEEANDAPAPPPVPANGEMAAPELASPPTPVVEEKSPSQV